MEGASPPATEEENAPIRVLIVINRLTELGGAEGSTALIIDGLQGDSIRFVVVTLHELALSGRERLESRGVVFRQSGSGLISQVRTVATAVREFAPDLIHATLFDADLVSCIVGFSLRVPVLRSIVNTPYEGEAARSARSGRRLDAVRRLDGFLGRHATARFHSISKAAEASAVRSLGIDPAKVVVVPRGRDPEVLGDNTAERRSRVRGRLGLSEDVPVLINVARQDPQKGQLVLLDALARLLSTQSDAVLVVAGRVGPETPRLEAMVQKLGLANQVRFLGVRDDVPDLLCAADVFVFSSLWEGLGGAVLEAMALGVPVVSFAVPAVAEALGGTGVLVPIGDANALGGAVGDLLSDASRRAELSRASRERFDACYTNAVYLAGMTTLYRTTVALAGRHK
jgi:glycosyltransferase involved in cell wall biosynthesis